MIHAVDIITEVVAKGCLSLPIFSQTGKTGPGSFAAAVLPAR